MEVESERGIIGVLAGEPNDPPPDYVRIAGSEAWIVSPIGSVAHAVSSPEYAVSPKVIAARSINPILMLLAASQVLPYFLPNLLTKPLSAIFRMVLVHPSFSLFFSSLRVDAPQLDP